MLKRLLKSKKKAERIAIVEAKAAKMRGNRKGAEVDAYKNVHSILARGR